MKTCPTCGLEIDLSIPFGCASGRFDPIRCLAYIEVALFKDLSQIEAALRLAMQPKPENTTEVSSAA
jgi:hypothetical protein